LLNYYERSMIMKVVGEGEGDVLLEINTSLKNPDKRVQNPIIDEVVEIQNIEKFIFPDKVVIQGELIKNIIFKAQDKDNDFIGHQTVTKPFTLELQIPGLKRGINIGKRLIFPKNIESELNCKIFVTDIISKTRIMDPIKDRKQDDHLHNHSDSLIIVRNQGLSDKFKGKGKDNDNDKRKRKDEEKNLPIHEKVLIKFLVMCFKPTIKKIKTEKPKKSFSCNNMIECKKSIETRKERRKW